MAAPIRIETTRLVLSPPVAEDADAIFERFASDPDVTRYMGWPRHRTLAETRGFLAFSARQWQEHAVGPYLIRDREDARLLGASGLEIERPGEAMTGYVLAKDAWGRGYATETLRAMVSLARGIGLTRLRALCHPDHRASQRVLEKCGFERDTPATIQNEFPNLVSGLRQDAFCYAIALRS